MAVVEITDVNDNTFSISLGGERMWRPRLAGFVKSRSRNSIKHINEPDYAGISIMLYAGADEIDRIPVMILSNILQFDPPVWKLWLLDVFNPEGVGHLYPEGVLNARPGAMRWKLVSVTGV